MTSPSTPFGNASSDIGFLQHRGGDRIKHRYVVLERLGSGNFGSVYRVHDTAVGNVLACKEMHVLDDPATPQDERAAALDLFKREALNLATLRHPNIPAAYFEQEDGPWQVCPVCGFDFPGGRFCPDHGAPLLDVTQRHYLMMDFIDGPTLEELAVAHLREHGRPLDEAQCLEWIEQIASALRSLHRVGIVHRDIKPDNIKIRSDENTAMLLDFGLTKKSEEAGSYGTVRLSGTTRFGTPGYAPENVRELERPEPRSDIYALGMTLYRLLAGRDPQDEAQRRTLQAFPPRSFNAQISPAIEGLILKATAHDPAARYQSIDELLAALHALHAPPDKAFAAPPFTFADGSRARTAADLARLVEKFPQEAVNYLFNGMIAGWLRQSGFAAPAQVAEEAVQREYRQPARALELFRRALYPSGASNVLPRLHVAPGTLEFGALDSGARAKLPLRVRNAGPGLLWGRLAAMPDELARNPHHPGGDATLPGLVFPATFEGNDVTLEVSLDTAKLALGDYRGWLLLHTGIPGAPEVRVPVAYTVSPLRLAVEPVELDFGTVLVGKRASRPLRVFTERRRRDQPTAQLTPAGQPRGTIFVGSSLAGLTAPERFEGDESIEIVVDGTLPNAVAQSYEGALQLDTNGGRLRVPVRYTLAMPAGRWLALLLGATLFGAAGGAALRMAYFVVNPDYATRWLITPQAAIVPPQFSGPGWIVAGALAGLMFALSLQRRLRTNLPAPPPAPTATAPARRPAPAPDSRGLLSTLPFFGLMGGMTLGAPLLWLLHWTLWGFGDWLLYPLARSVLRDLPRDAAPLAWAVTGALGGTLWGLGRAFAATGKPWVRYALWLALMLLFLAALLNAILSTGT